MNNDPMKQVEQIVKDIHDKSGKYAQPALRRYPLLFAFLTVFSVAAILHGFELVADQMELFNKHPSYLILVGAGALFFTGTLYKALNSVK